MISFPFPTLKLWLMVYLNYIYVFMNVYVCVCTHMQRSEGILGSQFPAYITWIPRIKLRSMGLLASAFPG